MPQVRDQINTQSAADNTAVNKKKAQGLTFRRFFTKPGVSPYSEVEWELRNAQITDSQGGLIFEQKNVEVPKDWCRNPTPPTRTGISPPTTSNSASPDTLARNALPVSSTR